MLFSSLSVKWCPVVLILREHGVQVAALDRWELPGLNRTVLDLRWKLEPGWIALRFDAPALFVALEEIGGRYQVRIHPDEPIEGEYFGAGHISFIAARQPVVVYANEMRQALLAVYLLDPEKADYLSSSEVPALTRAPSRYMGQNEAVQVCATLLGKQPKGAADTYVVSLTRALMGALLGWTAGSIERGVPRLTGVSLNKVFAYLLDALDQTVTVEELAGIAGIAPAQFGQAFRDATGLSPQQWQKDARVCCAQRLMVDDPTGSLADVAALAGFSDQSHFSRVFTEIVGLTPTAWLHRRA